MRIQPDNLFVVEAELTRRELEVLQLVAQGEQSKVIAHQLNISPKTVHVHRSRILLKMHARNMIEAVALVFTNQHTLAPAVRENRPKIPD